MVDDSKSDQARKGLLDSVKGKAKEIAGAVTGNDSLTAEGQLEQTQAQERKEANAVEAVADAEATKARTDAAEARQEGVAERISVNAETADLERTVEAQAEAKKRAAEQAGAQNAAVAKTQAEIDAQREIDEARKNEQSDVRSASKGFVAAVGDHQATVQDASSDEAEAERARQRAKDLTTDAELS